MKQEPSKKEVLRIVAKHVAESLETAKILAVNHPSVTMVMLRGIWPTAVMVKHRHIHGCKSAGGMKCSPTNAIKSMRTQPLVTPADYELWREADRIAVMGPEDHQRDLPVMIRAIERALMGVPEAQVDQASEPPARRQGLIGRAAAAITATTTIIGR